MECNGEEPGQFCPARLIGSALHSAIGAFINIREQVTLERAGKKYTGSFTINGWDTSGIRSSGLQGRTRPFA